MNPIETAVFHPDNLNRVDDSSDELLNKFLIKKLEKENAELREDNKKISAELNELIRIYNELRDTVIKIKDIFVNI